MKVYWLQYSCLALLCLSNIFLVKISHAQPTGTEQIVAKNIYKGDFIVAGDKDTSCAKDIPAVRRLLPSYGRNAAFSRSVKVPKIRVRKELRGL